MAVSSPLNPPSAGGLAGRPTRQVGGVRRQNETPLTFQNRMGGQPAGVTPPPMQTREDRILAARMDGTFDAKRSAFNAQAKGQFMDEAGNIAPTSQNFRNGEVVTDPSTGQRRMMLADGSEAMVAMSPAKPQFASAPDGRGGSKMVQIPATPAKPAAVTPPSTPTGSTILGRISAGIQAAMPGMNRQMVAARMAKGRATAEAQRGTDQQILANRSAQPANRGTLLAATPVDGIPNGMPVGTQRNPALSPSAPMQAKAATTAQTPKATTPVYEPGSVEARAQSLGNAMQINNSRQTAATVAKASQSSQDMAMAQGAKTFNLLTQGKPLQSPTPPPLTPAEQLAESVRPGSVAAHRAVMPPKMTIAARADGGPVQAGKPYLVGERGPEIIVPKQSGTVIPNHQLPAKVTAPSFKFKPAAALMAARG